MRSAACRVLLGLIAAAFVACSSSGESDQTSGGGAGAAGVSGGGAGGSGATDGGAGTAGSSGSSGAAGSHDGGAGSQADGGECATAGDCMAKLPTTQPPDCAEAECNQNACRFLAKDKDKDGVRNKFCKDPTQTYTIETGKDCNDSDPTIYPAAWDGPAGVGHANACDGVDQNCSGTPDDDILSDGTSCECKPGAQADCSETAGEQPIHWPTGTPIGACKYGTKTCSIDVNSGGGKWSVCVGAVAPATEVCNNEDDDCNGATDEAAADALTWSCDGDGDGHPLPNPTQQKTCVKPTSGCNGQWLTGSPPMDDCDDTNPHRFPGNPELCGDEVDENCVDGNNDGFSLGDDCATGGVGACGFGTIVCTALGSATTKCEPAQAGPDTVCSTTPFTSGGSSSWDRNCDQTLTPCHYFSPPLPPTLRVFSLGLLCTNADVETDTTNFKIWCDSSRSTWHCSAITSIGACKSKYIADSCDIDWRAGGCNNPLSHVRGPTCGTTITQVNCVWSGGVCGAGTPTYETWTLGCR